MATTALGTGVTLPIDYSSRDYQSILNDLLTAIPSYLPEWTSTSPSDLGIALLELFSYQADILNYYVDRIGNEAFLPTAQQLSSVYNLAYLIDYTPTGVSPSSAVLTLGVMNGSPSFTLAARSQFSTASTSASLPITFETSVAHSFPANATGATVYYSSTTENGIDTPITVIQGESVYSEAIGTSNGTASQDYTLYNTGVIENSVIVYVDEGAGAMPWTPVQHLSDVGPYDASYALAIDATGVIYVNFGDGVNGRIPNPQALISATYRVGGGSSTNVGANQITVDKTQLGYFSTVTNTVGATGGADAENISQIQNNAPKSITAAGRCVSIQDYAAVALTVPGVAKAQAVATYSPSAVILYIHPGGGPYAPLDLLNMVDALTPALTDGSPAGNGYLDVRKMAGTSITVLPPLYHSQTGYVPVDVSITLQVQPNYNQVFTEQSVLQALVNLFDLGSVDFGQRISLSSVYTTCQAVGGVAYLVVTVLCRHDNPETLGDVVCAPFEIPVLNNPTTAIFTTTGGI